MRRLRVGDEVVVMRGDDKGKRGKITRILPDRDMVVIEGVNSVKRHIRQTPNRPGGILEVEAPIRASKVMAIDPETSKPTRVSIKLVDGKKQRVGKSGAALPVSGR